jgi:hypothetical protein
MHLISDRLVALVEKHSEEIVKRWVKRLLIDPTTSSFSKYNADYIEKTAHEILKNLSQWVSYDTTKEEVGKRYAQEGMDLFKMSIPLCEVLRALYTLRRTLWLFVENESAYDSAFQLIQMRELNDRVILFFDRAEFYVIRGYMEELNRKMKELWKLTTEDTDRVFFERSFYNR